MERETTLGNRRENASVLLPMEWQAQSCPREQRLAAELWLEAFLDSSIAAGLSFTLSASREMGVRCGFVVHAVDRQTAMEMADLVRKSANSMNPGQGLGEPEAFWEPEPCPITFDLVVGEGPGREIFSGRSGPWTLAASLDDTTIMKVELRGNDTFHGQPAVRCTVSIGGFGHGTEMMATLLAADTPGNVRLKAVPRISSVGQPPELLLPLDMAAHLVSAPARIEDAWPEHPLGSPQRALELVEEAVPPHAAIFGGSGLGKTTFFEHLVDSSFAAGNSVLVICPHGDLASRAATLAQRRQVEFKAVDFADQECVPRWNISVPPPDVAPSQWAGELVHVIRAAWHDAPEEYFGPVWRKSLRAALSVLVRDPQGPHPLTELASLLRPRLPSDLARWNAVLSRIADMELASDLKEVRTMLERDREQHTGLWIKSKLEPFIADDRVRRVIGHPRSTVAFDGLARGEPWIISAPASALGDEGASIIMATLLGQLWHGLRRRENTEQLVDVYVDEAHRIPPLVIAEILAEGRKFGVRIRLASQSLFQLDPEMRDVIMTNTGALGTFRIGPKDAVYLEPSFPDISIGTIARLDRHWLAITDGINEVIGPTEPPIVDSDNRSALTAAHRRQHTVSEDVFEGMDTWLKEERGEVHPEIVECLEDSGPWSEEQGDTKPVRHPGMAGGPSLFNDEEAGEKEDAALGSPSQDNPSLQTVAVRIVLEGGLSLEEAAHELGVPRRTLRNWVRAERRRRRRGRFGRVRSMTR